MRGPLKKYEQVQSEDPTAERNFNDKQSWKLTNLASSFFDCFFLLGTIIMIAIRFKNPILHDVEPSISSPCTCTPASLNFSTSSFMALSRICNQIVPAKTPVQTFLSPTSPVPSQTPSISPSKPLTTAHPTSKSEFDWVSMTHVEEFFEARMHTKYPLVVSNNYWSKVVKDKKHEWDRWFNQVKEGHTDYYNPTTIWTNNMPWTYLWSTSVWVFKGEDCAHVEGGVPFDAWFDARATSPQSTCERGIWTDSYNHETERDWKKWSRDMPWIDGEGSGCCSKNVASEDCLEHLNYRFNKWPYNGEQINHGKEMLRDGKPCCQVLWNQVNAQCSFENLVGCAADSDKDFDTCIHLKKKYPHIKLFEVSRAYVYSDECVKAFEEVKNLPENDRLKIPFPCVGDIHLLEL